MEQRSPKPQDAGLSPAGNARRAPYEGAARIAGHPAAKVLDAAEPCDGCKVPLILCKEKEDNCERGNVYRV